MYIPIFYSITSGYHLPLILFDQYIVYFLCYTLMRISLYTVCCLILVQTSTFKLRLYQQLFDHIWVMGNSIRFNSGHKTSLMTCLTQFISEHLFICYFVIRGNKYIWSRVLKCFLFTNLPPSIYFLIRVFLTTYNRLPLIDSIVVGGIFFVQSITILLVLYLLAKQSKMIHMYNRYIPSIQQLLYGKLYWNLKFKYDNLMYRLLEGPTYGVSIGSFWVITFGTMSKILLIYVYHVIFLISLKLEAETKKKDFIFKKFM